MAESDFFVNHKHYPRCARSSIMHNHTLKGGLRAGNFSMLASVNDIEVCAALCCEEKNCDLALMIGDNCYAGDCTSPELCKAIPIPPGSTTRSEIAYITAPSRKKPEDKWVNAGMYKIKYCHVLKTSFICCSSEKFKYGQNSWCIKSQCDVLA